MDFNKLTQKSQEAFTEAQNKAVTQGHVEVDGEHLLWALLDQAEGLVPRLLQRMDLRPESLKKTIEEELDRRPHVSGPGAEPGKIYVSQRLNRILVAAEQEAGEVAIQHRQALPAGEPEAHHRHAQRVDAQGLARYSIGAEAHAPLDDLTVDFIRLRNRQADPGIVEQQAGDAPDRYYAVPDREQSERDHVMRGEQTAAGDFGDGDRLRKAAYMMRQNQITESQPA